MSHISGEGSIDSVHRKFHLLNREKLPVWFEFYHLSQRYFRHGLIIAILFLPAFLDKPIPAHSFVERPLIKYTWDEIYEEAYEDPSIKIPK